MSLSRVVAVDVDDVVSVGSIAKLALLTCSNKENIINYEGVFSLVVVKVTLAAALLLGAVVGAIIFFLLHGKKTALMNANFSKKLI